MIGHSNSCSIGRPDDEVIRLIVFGAADARLGELGQPDREVDLGVGIVGAPAETALMRPHLPVHQAAELKRAVEIGRLPEHRRDAALAAAVAAAPSALGERRRRGKQHREADAAGQPRGSQTS